MGYRSRIDVVFYARDNPHVITPMPFAALKLWVDENYPLKQAEDEWCAVVEYDSDHNYIYITYEDVKWYPSDHVSAVEAAFDLFDTTFTDDPSVAYEFVRIGEDTGDIEEKRSDQADYRLGVNRVIYFE